MYHNELKTPSYCSPEMLSQTIVLRLILVCSKEEDYEKAMCKQWELQITCGYFKDVVKGEESLKRLWIFLFIRLFDFNNKEVQLFLFFSSIQSNRQYKRKVALFLSSSSPGENPPKSCLTPLFLCFIKG